MTRIAPVRIVSKTKQTETCPVRSKMSRTARSRRRPHLMGSKPTNLIRDENIKSTATPCRDTTKELEAAGLGLGANKTHWSSYPAKPGQTLHVDTEHTQWEQVLVFCGYDTGPERIIVGIDQTQTASRDSIHAKVGTRFQAKVCEWRKKDTFDENVSVGKRPVGKCVMDADKVDEWCGRQLECAPPAQHWVSREVQRRRWINGGEDRRTWTRPRCKHAQELCDRRHRRRPLEGHFWTCFEHCDEAQCDPSRVVSSGRSVFG